MNQMNFNEYKKIAEEHLLDYLPPVDERSITIYNAMKYSLEAGGKRLRPVLVLATCDFCGGDIKDALPYALAMEYIHTYSLIHDDLPCVDNDDLRRGKPTNHVMFGEAMATLAGDGLLNSAFEAMLSDMKNTENTDSLIRKIKAADAIGNAAGCLGMIAGQVADIEAEGKSISVEHLDYINKNKTGAIIRAAVQAGAYLGGADEDLFNDLTEYAEDLGLAFQIRDDILDITGTVEELGKNVGHDEETNKSTYPAIFGLEESEKRLEEVNNHALKVIEKYDNAEFYRELVEMMANRRK